MHDPGETLHFSSNLPPLMNWKDCNLRLGRVGHSIPPAGRHCDNVWFGHCLKDDYDFWFCVRGSGRFTTPEGESFHIGGGSCIWMRQGATYDYRVDDEGEAEMRYHHFSLLDERGRPVLPDQLELPPLVYESFNPQFILVVSQQIHALLRGDASLHSVPMEEREMQAGLLFKSLLLHCSNEAGLQERQLSRGVDLHYQRVVSRVLMLLDESPHEISTPARMAQAAGYSPDHFSKIFRQITGRSPQEMIIQKRIERAQGMLQFGDEPISAIAERLGYQSPFYFTRQFVKSTGMSPAAWRGKLRK